MRMHCTVRSSGWNPTLGEDVQIRLRRHRRVGIVQHPALRYDEHSKPEFRFTLQQMEKEWPLYLPCFSPGAAGERLASEIDEGDHVVITSGKLAYRKRQTKAGEVSHLEILVWAVDRLPTSLDVDTSGNSERILHLWNLRCSQSRLAWFPGKKSASLGIQRILRGSRWWASHVWPSSVLPVWLWAQAVGPQSPSGL